MTENHDGALPARSRKPVDEAVVAARAEGSAIAVSKLVDLRDAIEASDDPEPDPDPDGGQSR